MAFSPKTRGRCWVGTIHVNNMIKAGLEKEEYENPEYVADYFISLWENSGKGRKAGIAVCISKEGCYHCHMACYGNTTTLKKVSDILFQSHIEPQLGGKESLKKYLLKEGEFAEKGEQVLYAQGLDSIEDNQGKRSDIEEIEDLINEGYTPEQIFDFSFRFRKYERMIKSAYLQKRIKETPLVKRMYNEYHFGESGTGKTFTYIRLCQEFSPEEVYLCNDYSNSGSSGGGFDFYTNNPAKIVVLDEYKGNVPYHNLLSLLDVYSRNQIHCRFLNTYCLWSSVIICSIYPPEKVYSFMVEDSRRNTDSIKQLLRRLNTIVYHFKDKNNNFRTFTMPASEYVNEFDIKKKASIYEKNTPYDKNAKDNTIESLKKLFEGVNNNNPNSEPLNTLSQEDLNHPETDFFTLQRITEEPNDLTPKTFNSHEAEKSKDMTDENFIELLKGEI